MSARPELEWIIIRLSDRAGALSGQRLFDLRDFRILNPLLEQPAPNEKVVLQQRVFAGQEDKNDPAGKDADRSQECAARQRHPKIVGRETEAEQGREKHEECDPPING